VLKKIKKINILITCVGGENGSEIVFRFKKNKFARKIYIVGTDLKNISDVVASKFLDKYYQVPQINKKSYIRMIDKIIKKHKINFILVTSDEESLI
jgi:hypothetical protein